MFKFISWLLSAAAQLGLCIEARGTGCLITSGLNFPIEEKDAVELISIFTKAAEKFDAQVTISNSIEEGILIEFFNSPSTVNHVNLESN